MENTLTREAVLGFLGQHRLAVIATVAAGGRAEAALIDIAVTPELEILFETTDATRKFGNLLSNPRAALVVGWDANATMQCEGVVDRPQGSVLERVKAAYLQAYPHKASHEFWPGNHYCRLTPTWFRLSDYNQPRRVVELELTEPVRERKKRGLFAGLMSFVLMD